MQAVAGVDFEVIPGEIVGLLGPNGAGKTTTLRMLTTLLEPTAGEAMIDGHDLARDPRDVRRSIGYVAQVGSAPSAGLRLGEELVTQARLQGMSKRAAEERVRELAPSLDLGGLEDRALLELSGGQRRRFDIAIGLMHSPPVIFLDEPTTGLDPQSRANLWEHISKLRRETGVSILLTTHYLEEADVLSDRILVMDHGRIVADDTPAALKARVHGDVIEVGVASADLERAEAATRAAVDAREISSGEDSLKVTVDEGAPVIARLLSALEAAGVSVGSVSIRRPSLDDVFLTLTGRSLREDSGEHDSDSEERAA
ncbi:MAG TPA: ATP-binding cassette domain-containing protein [Baekduia sp.]|nr:ATP-binding cassette domain-containing protein [Baekduia sp.]